VTDTVDSQVFDGWKVDYCEHPADTVQPTPPVLDQFNDIKLHKVIEITICHTDNTVQIIPLIFFNSIIDSLFLQVMQEINNKLA